MRKILFRGKRVDNGEWECGYYLYYSHMGKVEHIIVTEVPQIYAKMHTVIPETVGQFTGFHDKNGDETYSGHIVNFLGMVGEIVFESGAFGIVFDCIDWDLVEREMKKDTGYYNSLNSCYNDNFISLWEIYWNFDEEENNLRIIEVIGNIFDNPELLESEG